MESIKATEPIRMDWRVLSASEKQARHLGVDQVSMVAHNGQLTRESKICPVNPFQGWQDGSTPTSFQLCKRLALRVEPKDFPALVKIGIDPTAKRLINATSLLKAVGFTARELDLSNFPLKAQVTPCYLLACLVFNAGFYQEKPELISIANRFQWIGDMPINCKIGVDLFRVSLGCKMPDKVITVARERVIKPPKKQPNRLFKGGYHPAHDQSHDELYRLGMRDEVFFEHDGVRISLIRSHNRGKHVCTVRILNCATATWRDIGTIRSQSHKKSGKVCLFFSCPDLATDPETVKRAVKQAALDRDACNEKISAMTADLKAAKHKLQEITRKVRLDCLGLLEAKQSIEIYITDLSKQIRQLQANLPDLDQRLDLLSEDIAASTLQIFRSLGLNPNHWIRAIPKQSPLINSEFWMDWFSIEVSIQNNQPIELISDRRTQRQKSDRRNHKR